MQQALCCIDADPCRDRAAVSAHLDAGLLPADGGGAVRIGAAGVRAGGERLGVGEQNEPVAVDRGAAEQLLGADDDLIGGWARLDDVAGAAVLGRAGQTQALALADGETEVALVGAQDLAVGGDHGALVGAERAGQETAGVAVGHEADVVGVRLGGHRQAPGLGLGAHLRLGGCVPQGEEGPGQALATGDGQDVGLVLGGVDGAAQRETLSVAGAAGGGAAAQSRVVAGGDGVEAQGQGPLEESVELDALVAAHAGVGGAASAVLVEEVGHDALLELLGQVPHVEGDAQDLGGPAGVGGVLDGAAAA